jgi:ornithine cyclodeaminase/alanine dehydrogenase-like protein (mu-crystallin family)
MRYLSDRDARSLMPDADGALAVIDATLSAMAEGAVEMPPRTTLASGGPSRFIAFPARLSRLGVAGVKWFGIDHSPQAARKSASAQILLTAEEGARPLALIDASWITAWRTALMSLHAARLLARPGASRIAFIACGEQARLHLDAFRLYFPLTHLCAWSRTERTADEFAGNARASGLVAEIAHSVPACVEGADIVIASSPAVTETRFLPGALTPGSFVSLIDLGRSFIYEALAPSDRIHVDDLPQARALIARGDIPSLGGAQLLPLAGGGPPGLTTLPQIFLPTGLGAVDIALGHCIWQAAKDSGIGLILEDENGPA